MPPGPAQHSNPMSKLAVAARVFEMAILLLICSSSRCAQEDFLGIQWKFLHFSLPNDGTVGCRTSGIRQWRAFVLLKFIHFYTKGSVLGPCTNSDSTKKREQKAKWRAAALQNITMPSRAVTDLVKKYNDYRNH